MTPEQIKEAIVLADYLLVPKCGRCKNCGFYKSGSRNYCPPEKMEYHTSWNWLMPVWDKFKRDDESIIFDSFLYTLRQSIEISILYNTVDVAARELSIAITLINSMINK